MTCNTQGLSWDDLTCWKLKQLGAAWHLFLFLLESQGLSVALLHGFSSMTFSEKLDSYLEAQGAKGPRWKLQDHFYHMVQHVTEASPG